MKKTRIISNGPDRKCVVCGEPAFLCTSDSEYLCLRLECKHRTMSEIEICYDHIIDYENETLDRYEAEDDRLPIEKKAGSIWGWSNAPVRTFI